LYDLLESEVVPTFYDRGADGLPRRWIAHMKSAISTLCPLFNTQRMVKQYTTDFYTTSHERHQRLIADGSARVRGLAAWLSWIQDNWANVRVEGVDAVDAGPLHVGDQIRVKARVRLGAIKPEDVAVELYLGRLGTDGEIAAAVAIPMEPAARIEDGIYAFETHEVACRSSGSHGYTVRVLPYHPDEARSFLPSLIRWANEETVAAAKSATFR